MRFLLQLKLFAQLQHIYRIQVFLHRKILFDLRWYQYKLLIYQFDGQIFLDGDLFNSGVRPAINVGISVSRVGGNAQIKSMKKVSGTLKLDQAQFRELEAFAKFGSDLDAVTLNVIEKGKRNVEILKQGLNSPFTVEDQVAIIYAGSKNLLRNVPVVKVKEFEKDFLEYLNAKHRDTLDALKAGKFDDAITDVLEKVAKEISAKYN